MVKLIDTSARTIYTWPPRLQSKLGRQETSDEEKIIDRTIIPGLAPKAHMEH